MSSTVSGLAGFRMDLGQPRPLSKQFDLAICLEVTEHLPASSADGLIPGLPGYFEQAESKGEWFTCLA